MNNHQFFLCNNLNNFKSHNFNKFFYYFPMYKKLLNCHHFCAKFSAAKHIWQKCSVTVSNFVAKQHELGSLIWDLSFKVHLP